MRKACWEKNLFELIRRTSTDLPSDVELALKRALRREKKGSRAHWAIQAILDSAELARAKDVPICQDTGTLIFYLSVPVGSDTNALVARTRTAVAKATRAGYLRQNTIDAVSGAKYETNIAHASPVFHFEQGARKTFSVKLVMTGAGPENVGCQYMLPDADLKAECDLEGVRRCILDAVWKAQGRGCTPAVLGVCVGGDRATGYAHAKEQFLHKVGEHSRVKSLERLQERIMRESRKLGIGPMGLGGKTTLLGVNIGSLSRISGCFFVSVACMCWAFRRRGAIMGPEGGVHRWLY